MKNLTNNHEILKELFEDDTKQLKLSAINNNVRYAILEILRKVQDKSRGENQLYSREINAILLEKYEINITPQMLGQHLRILVEANLVEEKTIKREVPNKIGKRRVNGYNLKDDAFEEILLEISFLTDELVKLKRLFKSNEEHVDDNHCILTVFNGKDKGKRYIIHPDESVFIGRKGNYNKNELLTFTIRLDNSYQKVSTIDKPHIKIYHEDKQWYIFDKNSIGGTYLDDKIVPHSTATKVRNNSFIRLSHGIESAIIYCSY
ncbi:MAG: FHA domain-containing protein [Methanosphaera sp.]|nr:FHA domain-containing protein [Methanosphaera sp.]